MNREEIVTKIQNDINKFYKAYEDIGEDERELLSEIFDDVEKLRDAEPQTVDAINNPMEIPKCCNRCPFGGFIKRPKDCKLEEVSSMGYLELVNKFTAITNEIGYIEDLMTKDIALKRKLERLREAQAEAKREIDMYNGVRDDGR
ncbi:MAG: hypothetical protein Q4A42_03105 [Tissierellia bacterium]|nr:hypothetical protein [Tissierellia bacterium]